MVEEDLGRLETLRADGISKFQPIRFAHCHIGDSQTDPPVYDGLSDFGREAVQPARALGMVLDCAHATLKATADMAEAKHPDEEQERVSHETICRSRYVQAPSDPALTTCDPEGVETAQDQARHSNQRAPARYRRSRRARPLGR